jgi:hypothetical protein
MMVFKKTYSGDQSLPWADSRLVCLTAKNITAGSRIPTSTAVLGYGSPALLLILLADFGTAVFAAWETGFCIIAASYVLSRAVRAKNLQSKFPKTRREAVDVDNKTKSGVS